MALRRSVTTELCPPGRAPVWRWRGGRPKARRKENSNKETSTVGRSKSKLEWNHSRENTSSTRRPATYECCGWGREGHAEHRKNSVWIGTGRKLAPQEHPGLGLKNTRGNQGKSNSTEGSKGVKSGKLMGKRRGSSPVPGYGRERDRECPRRSGAALRPRPDRERPLDRARPRGRRAIRGNLPVRRSWLATCFWTR